MPLSTYSELQDAVLGWLARPGDPLVAPAVPEMVRLFESEANRRLRVIDAERYVSLVVPDTGYASLPQDCWAIRSVVWSGGIELEYVPPGSAVFWQQGGTPRYYTLMGFNENGFFTDFWLFVGPMAGGSVTLAYQVGVPLLSATQVSNWLLDSHPDAYLFGTLAEAELYIGHDERAPLWLQRRDATFQSLENYDRKTRWSGPMQIRAHGITMPASGSGGSTSTASPVVVADVAVRVVDPFSGDTVSMLEAERALYVDGGPRASLTIRLPPNPQLDMLVEIGFSRPVTTLTVSSAIGLPIEEGPTSAYGPGAGLQLRYIAGDPVGWVLWK